MMSGTYSNAPCTEEGSKISITLAILEELLVASIYHEIKIPTVDMKVKVYSKLRKNSFGKK
jgi:hypothetical protein